MRTFEEVYSTLIDEGLGDRSLQTACRAFWIHQQKKVDELQKDNDSLSESFAEMNKWLIEKDARIKEAQRQIASLEQKLKAETARADAEAAVAKNLKDQLNRSEEWAQYRDTEYMVSNLGNVKNHLGRELKGAYDRDYRVVMINIDGEYKNKGVHRLVADCFVMGRFAGSKSGKS